MDITHRNNLRFCRQKIVEDLNVLDVIDSLIENDIVNDEDQEKILSEKTRKAQVRSLLDTIPMRGPKAYSVFIESLRENYCWLVEELESKDTSDKTDFSETNYLNDILLKGGVPHPPSFSITRLKELAAIKEGLSELKPGKFLTLHGMPGSGKSVLAAESVRDPRVTLNNFPGGVFWFKVGMVDTDQLLNKLRALCTKLDSSILPASIEEAQEILRKLFLSRHLSDSLLILDDVWRPEVIQTFTLPVRVMVTTQDVSVMEIVRDRYNVVEIRSGFTVQESMELFSSYLKIPADYLPTEATAIHDECKGSPMVISLIGSLISESGRCRQTQRQSGRWQYYLQNLKTRRYSKLKRRHISCEHESVMGAVQMSVDNLEPGDKEKYEKLAVFLDDDPIPIKTLEILWSVDKYEVEDTMNTFLKKCLASCEADSSQDSLVYTLHDLQLDYLKTRMKDDPVAERRLHEDFVNEYFRKVNYRYENIKNDGYIFSHLGYHLTMAGLTPLFPDIYLNLGYVEANLKATGPVDILSDYRKYRQFIMGEEEKYEEALYDFEEFCRTVGAQVWANKDADVVQLGLREVESSEVYLAAKRLADERPETLYLEWRNRSSVTSNNIATMNHPGSPKVVKFLPEGRLVTGTSDGNISVWNVDTGDILEKLYGHKADVMSLAVDPEDEDVICSGSEDGTVRQWRLKPFEDVHNSSGDSLSLRRKSLRRSPKCSSTLSLEEMFQQASPRDQSISSIVVGQRDEDGVLALAWRPEGSEVAAGGRTGAVNVYNLTSGRLQFSLAKAHSDTVNCLSYSRVEGEKPRLASASDDCSVRVWSCEGQFLSSLNMHTMRVSQVSWVGTRNCLASLSAEQIYLWHSPGSLPLHTVILRRNRASSWTSLAASQTCVAAGTAEDKLVLVWSVDSQQLISALPGQTSPVSSLDFSCDGRYLASTSEETLMVWNVEMTDSPDTLSPLSLGPPHMTRWRQREAVTAAPDDSNRIVLLRDGAVDTTSQVLESQVTCLHLSRDLRSVVFGTEDGAVKVFRCSEGTVETLFQHEAMVTNVTMSDYSNVVVSGALGSVHPVRIHNLDTGTSQECEGEVEAASVRDVRIIQRGDAVLSCSLQGRLHVWDLTTGQLTLDISGSCTGHATCLDVQERDGETLAAVSGVAGGVKIVELRTGQKVMEVGPASVPVRVVRFSPDGKLLVTGHDTGTVQYLSSLHVRSNNGEPGNVSSYHLSIIQVWDAVTGSPISSPLTLHSSWVTDLSISSDCSTLLTAGDRLVWWSIPPPPPPPSSHHLPARRKLSLPIPRSRRSSGSKSNRDSLHEDMVGLSISPIHSATITTTSPPSINPFRRQGSGYLDTLSLPSSPVGKRKLTKTGSGGQKELLQTFDIKGFSVNKVWVNKEFTQFVTVDDAGICYILDEFIPSSYQFR